MSATTTFITYQGKEYSANQAYDYAKGKGYSGSFADFVNEYGTPEMKKTLQERLDKAQGLASTIQDIFGKFGAAVNTVKDSVSKGKDGTPVDLNTPSAPSDQPTLIFGMPKGVAILVGVVAISLIGYGIYTIANKGTAAPAK